MAGDEALSWKAALGKVRNRVVTMEERRTREKKLERQRNESSLKEQLASDTAEALSARFADIRKRFDRGVRKFFPLKHIETVRQEIGELCDLLQFYKDCMKQFSKVFTPAHKTTIPNLLREIEDLNRGLDRQIRQWQKVADVTGPTGFRPRESADDAALVEVAKAFSMRAHKVPLSIPGDYFAHEDEDFWVAEAEGNVLGYVKFFPEEKVVTFALVPAVETNFKKFIRAILYRFLAEGPLPEKMDAARVRISYVREVKFFTDMGFVRTEVKGPSDWIYQREIG